jgi:quinoprotein glucose dehydrogenase
MRRPPLVPSWSATVRVLLGGLALAAARPTTAIAQAPARPDVPWPSYGNDAGGTRWSPLSDISRANVARLAMAWDVSLGDLQHGNKSAGPREGCAKCHTGATKFEATPLAVDGTLYLSTTGSVRWRFDPKLALNVDRNEGYVSRGVALWRDARATGPLAMMACARRIFFATVDARLFALNAGDGRACAGFGDRGVVRLDRGVGQVQVGQYGVTSPPVVARDVVIVGSSIGDNRLVEMEHGTVRAYDARTGVLRWAFDPVPRDSANPAWSSWTPEGARKTGAANAWAPLSVDTARGLVFVPTGSASPDFYGGERAGDNRYANSVVALDVASGAVRWHFQVVHHDLWDYDVASQPTLITLRRGGREQAAVVVATKMGFVYVLDRETGVPLFPVEERAAPASTVPGEVPARTQPWPVNAAFRVHPTAALTAADVWGPTPEARAGCLQQFATFRHDGIFTPPSLEGTLMHPFYGGGINWGGVTFDPERQLLVVNSMRLPAWVRLRKRQPGEAGGNMRGTPYVMDRAVWVGPTGVPCVRGPWGMLRAIDLATGTTRWERPIGVEPRAPAGSDMAGWGTPNVGGSLATAGGLVFIAATRDERLRALDIETGRELWSAPLPAGGQATPMTYRIRGKQYVVIAAGGHGDYGTRLSDHLVAFAIP